MMEPEREVAMGRVFWEDGCSGLCRMGRLGGGMERARALS